MWFLYLMNYFNVLLQVAIYWTTVITNWQFFVVSLPHELFQFVASSCHLLNNYDHKLRICGFFYIMNYIFYYVASSCDLLNNWAFVWFLSLMNWFDKLFQVVICWTTIITNWAFVGFLSLMNWFDVLLKVAICWTLIIIKPILSLLNLSKSTTY